MFNIGNDHEYFNDNSEQNLNNERVFRKVAEKCYLPTNAVLLELLNRYPDFKVSFSLSGVFLEQAERYMPEVLASFHRLVKTGRVELLGETYYHSLASLYSFDEFAHQVRMHGDMVRRFFGVSPRVFRNTECIYNNEIARFADQLGFVGVIAEGADDVLEWRSPNFVYTPVGQPNIRLLLKNYRLSDDIAFRFSSRDWKEWPLNADKFASWVSAYNGSGEVINLFMDYETFGEHQWESTGIFDFLRSLPGAVLANNDNNFKTPSEVIATYPVRGELDVQRHVSWADVERDLSAWRSNAMQHSALDQLYGLREHVLATKDERLIDDWRKLQTSDHFYYMCTKWFADGDVHKYFNPYESPYEAFIAFMNVFNDLKLRIQKSLSNALV